MYLYLLLLLSSSLLMVHPFQGTKPGNISTTLVIQDYNISPLSFRRVAKPGAFAKQSCPPFLHLHLYFIPSSYFVLQLQTKRPYLKYYTVLTRNILDGPNVMKAEGREIGRAESCARSRTSG